MKTPLREWGVINLLAILKHDASAFWHISRILERLSSGGRVPAGEKMNLKKLAQNCERLDLRTSLDQIVKLVERITANDRELNFTSAIENLASVIHSELKARVFVYVPAERAKYVARDTWADVSVHLSFPSSIKELYAAGRCYAYGEPDASIYHAMRALEPCLEALAVQFGVEYAHRNWYNIINEIEAAIRQVSKSKRTEQEREDEHFYGQIAAQFVFVKDGWRNYVMHSKERYSDREAERTLSNVEGILELASRKLKEVKP
jgi:hypothetical protein